MSAKLLAALREQLAELKSHNQALKSKVFRSERFLKGQIKSILDFYVPVALDNKNGGYNNQLLDNGTVYDPHTKHIVGTCRFVVNFSMAFRLFKDPLYKQACEHGVTYLMEKHCDGGSFAWMIGADGSVIDSTRYMYAQAFSLLALSEALKIGVKGCEQHIEKVWKTTEEHFYEPDHQLYRDQFTGPDFSDCSPYRGQNSNMHMCEALLSLFQSTSNVLYLDRAVMIAEKLCLTFANEAGGRLWEHYDSGWKHDWDKNKEALPGSEEHIFRPYGYQPGHFFEWAKLLMVIQRHKDGLDWIPGRARFLFDEGVRCAWDQGLGGVHYGFSVDGETSRVLDTDKFYWVMAEMIGAAALLGAHLGPGEGEQYWQWFDKAWTFSTTHMIDGDRGGWYPQVNAQNQRTDPHGNGAFDCPVKSYPSKTDYHPLAACFEAIGACSGQ
jgi:mannose/cellobiose epimerase-like protein (N-acyl-D-glucosamine 2-epimerase family)